MNTNKGSVVKQSGNDVEGCRSEKVLVQPNTRVFLQYSVIATEDSCWLTNTHSEPASIHQCFGKL